MRKLLLVWLGFWGLGAGKEGHKTEEPRLEFYGMENGAGGRQRMAQVCLSHLSPHPPEHTPCCCRCNPG